MSTPPDLKYINQIREQTNEQIFNKKNFSQKKTQKKMPYV